jgi:hypothetical protein
VGGTLSSQSSTPAEWIKGKHVPSYQVITAKDEIQWLASNASAELCGEGTRALAFLKESAESNRILGTYNNHQPLEQRKTDVGDHRLIPRTLV